MATHENFPLIAGIAQAIEPHLSEGEKIIWRSAWRWHDKNGALSNHYECQDIMQICDDHDYDLVHDFNHVAVVKKKVIQDSH